MPQPPPKPWKKAIFRAIAHAEHALRGGHPPTQIELSQIRNFLFLQYESPLGSVIHATPVFEALKRALPDAHIAVAASSMAANVLDHNPYIDRCMVTPDPRQHFNSARQAVRDLLQSMPPGPRAIVTTIGNRRPRIALLSLVAGNALHIGHTAAPEFYDIPLEFRLDRGQIEGNLDLLRRLGHNVSFCEPTIFFTQNDAEYAARLLEAGATRTRIAFVTRNSGGQRNRWSEDRFQQAIAQLSQTYDATPVFLGTSADATALEALRRTLPNSGISAAGKTTVSQLAALLAQCDLIVSLDTGPFHVARAVALPGVVIAPAWQNPLEWLPVGHPKYRVLRGPSIMAPPSGYCMEEISVEQAIASAAELLHAFPASDQTRQTRIQRSLAISR